jgi:hypothetical protein
LGKDELVLAIWNQARIKVRIWEKMSLAKRRLERGQRRSHQR